MNIVGHQKQQKLLDRIIKSGKISQAYLFSGPEHVGKFTLALEFAGRLSPADDKINPRTKNKEDAVFSNKYNFNSEKINFGVRVNPDLMIVRTETGEDGSFKKDIPVERVREALRWLTLTPAEGKYRVLIIDNAHQLNVQAQNALLKTLEEPNPRNVIVIVAKDEKKLLPTIISRCLRINYALLPAAEISQNIPAGTEKSREVAFWSLGRPGLMLEMLRDKNILAARQSWQQEFNRLFDGSLDEKFKLAEEMAKDVRISSEKLEFWQALARENFLGENRNGTAEKNLALAEKIAMSLKLLRETNANPRLILENLFI